jgi:hypothetical protein
MAQWQNCINNFDGYGFTDKASSLYNHGNYDTLYFYTNKNAGGYEKELAKGYVIKQLDSFWNDVISSVYFASAKKYA